MSSREDSKNTNFQRKRKEAVFPPPKKKRKEISIGNIPESSLVTPGKTRWDPSSKQSRTLSYRQAEECGKEKP